MLYVLPAKTFDQDDHGIVLTSMENNFTMRSCNLLLIAREDLQQLWDLGVDTIVDIEFFEQQVFNVHMPLSLVEH